MLQYTIIALPVCSPEDMLNCSLHRGPAPPVHYLVAVGGPLDVLEVGEPPATAQAQATPSQPAVASSQPRGVWSGGCAGQGGRLGRGGDVSGILGGEG